MAERHAYIVAHPDDDLVFMCPTLLDNLRARQPVLTIYLTAGDAGRGREYWQRREVGIVAAYAAACNRPTEDFAECELAVGTPPLTACLTADGLVRLVFLRLADGMLDGAGSSAHGGESLPQLWHGDIHTLHALDGAHAYSCPQLIDTLARLLRHHEPTLLHTLNPSPLHTREHPDHRAAALLAIAAADRLTPRPHLRRYVGSNSPTLAANVHDGALREKQRIFALYAAHDPEIIGDDHVYVPMLAREYVL